MLTEFLIKSSVVESYLLYNLFHRYGEFDKLRKEICSKEGGLSKFSLAFKTFGIHFNEDNSVSCKEWAPGANQLFLYGDFSMRCFMRLLFFNEIKDCHLCFFRWLGQAQESLQET